MKKIFLILITIILVLTSAACQSSDGNNTRSGDNNNLRAAVVDDFLGEVTAVSSGEDMPAFKGLALLRQDSLGTGAESWSSLELSESRFVLVEENSDVLISQLADDAKNAEVTLSSGKIWVVITDKLADDEGFEVVTPTCSLSIRGTVFAVSCGAEGGSRAAVYEGTVQFTAEDETGNEVSYDVTRGVAEVVVENGIVAEIRQSGLTYEDLVLLREDGPGGPGGVYDVLRSLLNDRDGAAVEGSADTFAAWVELTGFLGLPPGSMSIYDIPGITADAIARFESGPGPENGNGWSDFSGKMAFRVGVWETTGDYAYFVTLDGKVSNVEFTEESLNRLWGFSYGATTKDEVLRSFSEISDRRSDTNRGIDAISYIYEGYGGLYYIFDSDLRLYPFCSIGLP